MLTHLIIKMKTV